MTSTSPAPPYVACATCGREIKPGEWHYPAGYFAPVNGATPVECERCAARVDGP